MYDMDLLDHTDTVNEQLARYGVKFGIYKNNTFKEQLFPFDAIPRIIEKSEFDYLHFQHFSLVFQFHSNTCTYFQCHQ